MPLMSYAFKSNLLILKEILFTNEASDYLIKNSLVAWLSNFEGRKEIILNPFDFFTIQ
jgi:hypothetical protein